MAIGLLSGFKDTFCVVNSVWVFLHLEKKLSRGGRAVDERHLDGLKAQEMVAVHMTEEKCCWFWLIWVISEIVDPDTGEFLDNAVERRHGGGASPGPQPLP